MVGEQAASPTVAHKNHTAEIRIGSRIPAIFTVRNNILPATRAAEEDRCNWQATELNRNEDRAREGRWEKEMLNGNRVIEVRVLHLRGR